MEPRLLVKTPPACWCAQRLAITVEGPEKRFSVTTEAPFARIGSDEAAEVVLRHGRLPRRGLYLHATDEGVFWINLASPDTVKEVPRGWLPPDRRIHFGPYRISARVVHEAQRSAGAFADLCAKGSLPEPHPRIVVMLGDLELARRRLTRRLTLVGRRPPAALRIDNDDLSDPHLVLYWQAGSLWAIDLLSRNGLRLNGSPIDVGRVPEGASIALGAIEIRYAPKSNGQGNIQTAVPLPTGLCDTDPSGTGLVPPIAAIESSRAALADERAALEAKRQEYDQRRAELEALRAELEALRRDLEDERLEQERARGEVEAARMALADERAALEAKRQEHDQRRAELEALRAELEARGRTLEDERLKQERARGEIESSRAAGQAAGHSPGASSTGPVERPAPSQDTEGRYEEVLDRLFQVSRARRSWWQRLRAVFLGQPPYGSGFQYPEPEHETDRDSEEAPPQ
ncbi:MAG: FHA domain-containing protein [Thermoguttaceae bacterium]|nr:FHA domain-containing protein [Thermoguttaceae bacterium]